MNKTQLIEALSKETKASKAESKRFLDAYLKVKKEALKTGDKIALVGFGSFSVAHKPARDGRNPRTGKAIKIGAKKTIKFRPGSELLKHVK